MPRQPRRGADLADRHYYPSGLRIHDQSRGGERDPIGHAGVRVVKTEQPRLSKREGRQHLSPEGKNNQRQNAAEDRGGNGEFESVAPAEPKGDHGGEFGVAATDPAKRKHRKRCGQHDRTRRQMEPENLEIHPDKRRREQEDGEKCEYESIRYRHGHDVRRGPVGHAQGEKDEEDLLRGRRNHASSPNAVSAPSYRTMIKSC